MQEKTMLKKQNKDIFIIAGLGNPDDKYYGTRHNVGFDAIDTIANKYKIKIVIKKFNGYIGKGFINGHNVILLKPMTYINNSGECIVRCINYEKVDCKNNLLIICDDIHLPIGKIRVKRKGSDGGHNGLKNVSLHLGSNVYPRIRFGVGNVPIGYDQVKYVLGHFNATERNILDNSINEFINELPYLLDIGIEHAMNILNGR